LRKCVRNIVPIGSSQKPGLASRMRFATPPLSIVNLSLCTGRHCESGHACSGARFDGSYSYTESSKLLQPQSDTPAHPFIKVLARSAAVSKAHHDSRRVAGHDSICESKCIGPIIGLPHGLLPLKAHTATTKPALPHAQLLVTTLPFFLTIISLTQGNCPASPPKHIPLFMTLR